MTWLLVSSNALITPLQHTHILASLDRNFPHFNPRANALRQACKVLQIHTTMRVATHVSKRLVHMCCCEAHLNAWISFACICVRACVKIIYSLYEKYTYTYQCYNQCGYMHAYSCVYWYRHTWKTHVFLSVQMHSRIHYAPMHMRARIQCTHTYKPHFHIRSIYMHALRTVTQSPWVRALDGRNVHSLKPCDK